ncbi:MAG: DNA adenine methylase, partial [Bacteroidetes bacterium RIFOXYA12_FULL_33_9]
MPHTEITINISNNGTRDEVRKRVFELFFKEPPGKGGGELASKYTYYVEKLKDGKFVYLTRPANLKKGFDFLVRVQNIDFSKGNGRYRDYPKHDDIIEDLKNKFEENIDKYQILYSLISKVYNCRDIDSNEYNKLFFSYGYPTDLILFTLKWLFIEQDIRDWS